MRVGAPHAVLMGGLAPKDLVAHMVRASREVRSLDLSALAGKSAQHCFHAGGLAARAILEAQRLRVRRPSPASVTSYQALYDSPLNFMTLPQRVGGTESA